MVYCGRPSKACHACRKRKTKCDSKPGGCGQCFRVGRECPGYRKQIDLLFRDHTNEIIQRSQGIEARKHMSEIKQSFSKHVQKTYSTASQLVSRSETNITDPLLIYALQPGIDECAICYFVSNYVSALQSPLMGSFTVLQELYLAPHVELVLTTSIKAAGLASYGGFTRNNNLIMASRSEYVKAIKQVNLVIQSSTAVSKDSTLLSVLLLIQYEMQTGTSEMALSHWEKHIQGAATLLALRGAQQFESTGGRLLFAEVLKFLLTCSLQRRLRVPKEIQRLTHLLHGFPSAANSGLHILESMIELNDLRVDIVKFNMQPVVAVERLALLDLRPSQFYDHHPWPWHFEKCKSHQGRQDFAFEGQYAVYTNVYLASAWNALRATRIYIHNEICQVLEPHLASLSQYYRNVYNKSISIGQRMRADILASVPQHLGHVEVTRIDCETQRGIKPASDGEEERQKSATHSIRKQPRPETSHYHVLLWPIWFVGYDPRSTNAVRQYCVRILRRIGHEIGLQHALVLARIVETYDRSRLWIGG